MDVRTIINDTLDRIQERERLNDQALARRLEVDPVTVYRWRKGDVGKAASILIPLVVELRRTERTLEQAA